MSATSFNYGDRDIILMPDPETAVFLPPLWLAAPPVVLTTPSFPPAVLNAAQTPAAYLLSFVMFHSFTLTTKHQ